MAILTLELSHTDFDAFESAAGAITLNGASINLTAGGQWGGLGYPSVDAGIIGATINSATLRLYVYGTTNDSPILDVYLEKDTNSLPYTTATSDISARPRTTAKVSVSATNVGVGWYEITGLAAVVQEVIDQPGWSEGADLFPILDPLAGCDFGFRTYDHDPALAAELVIDYTPAAGGAGVGTVLSSRIFGAIVR